MCDGVAHPRDLDLHAQALGTPDPDAGYSLIELLIVMVIMTGIMGTIFAVLIGVQNSARDNAGRTEQVRQARLGLSQIDRQVRSGNVVVDPDQSGELTRSLRVYTQTDGVRRCVQWQAYQDTLRFRSWDPNWQVGGTVEAWRVVARDLRTDAEAPKTFEKVTAAGGSQAQSVRIVLWMDAVEANGRPVEISTILSGRNTVYGYSADICSPVPPA